jgi:hypothetical protein
LLYQAEVPASWELLQEESNRHDTTQAIASFKTEGSFVTIHNFPFIEIPPQRQIERWQRQLSGSATVVTPASHGGFVGLILESETMIAAAFELAPFYQKRLEPSEKSSSWTIKATGNVQQFREDILNLIHTFETIEEFNSYQQMIEFKSFKKIS